MSLFGVAVSNIRGGLSHEMLQGIRGQYLGLGTKGGKCPETLPDLTQFTSSRPNMELRCWPVLKMRSSLQRQIRSGKHTMNLQKWCATIRI